jgi:hypothetical protein
MNREAFAALSAKDKLILKCKPGWTETNVRNKVQPLIETGCKMQNLLGY